MYGNDPRVLSLLQMVLASMHKYLPFVHVVRASDKMALHCSPTASFAFPETEFMAVTAYQVRSVGIGVTAEDETLRLVSVHDLRSRLFAERGHH